MTGELPEGAQHPMFRDADEATQSLELLVGQLEKFRRQLGGSALNSKAIDGLLPLAEALNEGAADIIDVVVGLEEKEHFGDEESYWNVFRYFCVDGNVGVVRTLQDLWEHLALTFDMSDETIYTLTDTLDQWTADIENDAMDKFKISGKFTAWGGGFVFHESPTSAAKRKAAAPRQAPTTTPAPVTIVQPAGIEESVETAEEEAIGDRILKVMKDFGGSVKQSVVVKAIIESDSGLMHGDVLSQINSMVGDGRIHKFKPVRGGPAHLAISAEDAVVSSEQAEAVEGSVEQREEIDTDLARAVLELLVEPGRNPSQKIATSQMINTLQSAREQGAPKLEIRELNALVRFLATKGLVATDMGSPLAGRRKGVSRAKSQSVFRVGVADKETKDIIKRLLDSGELEQFLQ